MASQGGRMLHKLYIGNLPWTVGHRQLLEYFSQFGHVNSARVVFDKSTGLSRGYGFVEFSNRQGYDTVTGKQVHALEGSSLNVQPSTQ